MPFSELLEVTIGSPWLVDASLHLYVWLHVASPWCVCVQFPSSHKTSSPWFGAYLNPV